MNKFAFHKMDAIKGTIPFFKLEINGEVPIEQFENDLPLVYKGQFNAIHLWMERCANKQLIPYAKFHPLDEGKEDTGAFEFKTKHLRIYGMSLPGGKIVIFGGFKGTGQDQDIKRVKQIATEIKQQKISPNG
ncbi:MAG: hypothetical protein WC865_12080 [Bacteroidales bacterium]